MLLCPMEHNALRFLGGYMRHSTLAVIGLVFGVLQGTACSGDDDVSPPTTERRCKTGRPSIGGRSAHAPMFLAGQGEIHQPALAKGDFDADGKDEIAVGFGGSMFSTSWTNRPPAINTQSPFTGNPNSLFVAAGDVDGDPVDELVASYSENGVAKYTIYDGTWARCSRRTM
jgi:hypothetical protein